MNARIASGTVLLTTLMLVAFASPGRLEASMMASGRTFKIVEQELLKNVLKVDVKDSESSEYPRGFEIKVTNLSDKPVYHIEVMVEFPEVKQLRGTAFGLPLRFGDPELTDVARLAKSGQVSIMPGESVVLKPTDRQIEDYSKDLTGLFASRGKSLDQIRISFQSISHGDGTGYLIGIPYPQKNN